MPWPAPFFPRLLSLNMIQNENPILIIQNNMHDIPPWIIHWCVVVGASTEGWGPAVPHCSSCGCRNCLGISRETLPAWQHNATLRIYCNIHLRSPAPTWVDTQWKFPLEPFFLSPILLKKCSPFNGYPKMYSQKKSKDKQTEYLYIYTYKYYPYTHICIFFWWKLYFGKHAF